MIVNYNLTPGQNLTEDEKRKIQEEIAYARTLPQEFDDDCPQLSKNMMKSLKVAVRNRNRAIERKKA